MLKIILTGPESSGKTTLARQLAKHFNVPLVEEYARTFFEKKETPQYKQEDLLEIAHGQLDLEQQTYKVFENLIGLEQHLIISDTDLLTLKIWSNEVYGNCSIELMQLIDNQLISESSLITHHSSFITHHPLLITHHSSLITPYYFLCSSEGVNWEDDPLRENPHDRDRLFKIYETELKFYQKNYSILRGHENERFDKAVTKINQLLQNRV